MSKKVPIGISDFKTLFDENYYYVDKSLFIKEVIEDGSKVILIPRPRRFGKTLNMSILKCFYEKTNEDNRFLFKGLKIQEHKEIMDKQGKYPVIYLTFKDEKYSTWENCKKSLSMLISNFCHHVQYLLESQHLSSIEKQEFTKLMNKEADVVELSKSLLNLSAYLYKHHKQKVIILIDEYDMPIQEGYISNYYEEIIEFMRIFLSGGLKDNEYLEKSVLTGILKVAKESVFSGLNNLEVCSMLSKPYGQYFGFLENEVQEICRYYEIESSVVDIKKWYNGYIFGSDMVYNPWSILNFVKHPESGYKPYWVNTAECTLIKGLLAKGNEDVKKELESLVNGENLEKIINENIVMEDIDKNTSNIWSFLLFSGYLKAESTKVKDGNTYCNLQIPNMEVKNLYNQIILSWFCDNLSNDKFTYMLESLVSGDLETFEDLLSDFILKTASYFDIGNESERFYHSFVLGILVGLTDKYEVKSNRESGYGRYDILMIPKAEKYPGVIIEFKKVNKRRKETLEISVNSALKQISDKKYREELEAIGINQIMEIGIAFDGKDVMVRGD